MKNLLISLSILLVFSCKKSEIKPIEPIIQLEPISMSGEWLLVGGDMYIENLDNHSKTKYNHFDINKTISSLRYEGSLYAVESLTNNVTTWTFKVPISIPNYGDFILNKDTLKPFGFYVTNSSMRIMESPTATATTMQMGGSAIPIMDTTIVDYNNKIIDFKVFESFITINNMNYTYFSILKFKKIK